MRQVLVRCGERRLLVEIGPEQGLQGAAVEAVEALGLSLSDLRLRCDGKELYTDGRREKDSDIDRVGKSSGEVVVVEGQLRLLGGKGGFGSLLRGGNGQVVKKTTNFNACRDLSGRRIRHVNQEKQLKEWYQQQEQEKREKKVKGSEAKADAVFDSATFEAEGEAIEEMVSAAVKDVLAGKRKLPQAGAHPKRKRKARDLDPLFADMDSEDEDEDEDEDCDDEKMEKLEEPEKHQEDSSGSSSQGSASPLSSPVVSLATSASAISPESTTKGEGIDLLQFETAEALEQVGLDCLKEELLRLGLLCGGSLQHRAQRLFATKGKERSQWDTSLFKGKSKSKGKGKKEKEKNPLRGN